jgi:hypothetical protein
MKYAGATCGTFLGPYSSFFQYAEKFGIQSRVDRFIGIAFCDSLNTGTASEREYDINLLDCFGGLFDEDIVALTFYGHFIDFQIQTLHPASDAQGRRDDAHLTFAAGETYGYAGAASQYQDFLVSFKYF